MVWNHIRQHIPNFVDGVEPQEARFASNAELLEVPFVKRWAESPAHLRFDISTGSGQPLLMAHERDGKFWVVGYLQQKTKEGSA